MEEILNGELRLKVKNAGEVSFHDLTFHKLEASCQLSVIITCSSFLQRLRVSLRNWCHQELPTGTHEVLIVNPQSPDGTHEHLAAVARSYPHVRVREIAVGNNLVKNKGAMINRAFASSRGEWIWLTDADCVFGLGCAAAVLQQIRGRYNHLYYGERRFLTSTQTDALLSGRTDSLTDFAALAPGAVARQPERHYWGYTQIVHRSVFQRVRYSEHLNHFAHTDGMFAEACRRDGAPPLMLDGLFCLHLDHPFSWYGAERFL
ncbi:MAG: glycosyltransferase [Oxalobacteraceae bacterium]|nr:MAG: glycosyltransferase [Oxalobacteraceae bacterium]